MRRTTSESNYETLGFALIKDIISGPWDNQQVVKGFWWNLQEDYEDTSPSYALPESPPVGTHGIVPPYRPRQQFSSLLMWARHSPKLLQPNNITAVLHTKDICFTCSKPAHTSQMGSWPERLIKEKHSRPPWRPVGYCLLSRARTKRSSSTQTFTFRGRQCPRRCFGCLVARIPRPTCMAGSGLASSSHSGFSW